MEASPRACAREVLEVVPLVMRSIRAELRRHHSTDLSVPQFRTLGYVSQNAQSSLSEVAEHIGLALPSMSKTVDCLVARGLLKREDNPLDRRRMVLFLTDEGQSKLQAAREAAQADLAGLLAGLSAEQRAAVTEAMAALRSVFPDDCG